MSLMSEISEGDSVLMWRTPDGTYSVEIVQGNLRTHCSGLTYEEAEAFIRKKCGPGWDESGGEE